MFIHVLKSKIHQAAVTETNLFYNGSLTLDVNLMQQVGMRPYEKVHVVNINTGARFETYLIEGKPNSKEVCLNGAAARLGEVKDRIIIMSYGLIETSTQEQIVPKQIILDKYNNESKSMDNSC